MVAQPEEPDKRPDILDLNDPDAEGLFVGEELHSDTCPCDGCAEYWAAWQERYDKYVVPRTDAERRSASTAMIQAAKERRAAAKASREKEEDHEAWLAWDKLMGEYELAEAARAEADYQEGLKEEERQYQEQLKEDDPDGWLLNRRRAVEDREIARRERRQDARDAEEGGESAAGLTFADFGQEITLQDVEKLPSAFVRDDGETLLYEGVSNTIFGEPSSAKSWIGLKVTIQQLKAGRRVIWWDNEDRASTVARRLKILDAEDLIGVEALAFRTGDMHLSETAMAEALAFLDGGSGPGLVVIDSATAFTCPKDGADVHPWMASHISPWIDAGHTSLTLDHVPKQRKDRPAGAVGSYEKMSFIRGGHTAALYVHGIAWDAKHGGAVHLTVHKDAHGQLPAPKFSVVSTISAEWDGATLAYTIGPPNAKIEGEDLQDELMEAFDQVGAEGVRGSAGVRGLLKGKRGRDIDTARDELLQQGIIQREKVGRAFVWRAVTDDQ